MTLTVIGILVAGFVVGMAFFEYARRAFSDDPTLVRRIFADQPVTMTAAAITVGSVIVWGVLEILGIW